MFSIPIVRLDMNGLSYVEVGNIRITYVPAATRDPGKNWPRCDVIRIQAYRGEDTKQLHWGAELPISSTEYGTDLWDELKAALDALRASVKKQQ